MEAGAGPSPFWGFIARPRSAVLLGIGHSRYAHTKLGRRQEQHHSCSPFGRSFKPAGNTPESRGNPLKPDSARDIPRCLPPVLCRELNDRNYSQATKTQSQTGQEINDGIRGSFRRFPRPTRGGTDPEGLRGAVEADTRPGGAELPCWGISLCVEVMRWPPKRRPSLAPHLCPHGHHAVG